MLEPEKEISWEQNWCKNKLPCLFGALFLILLLAMEGMVANDWSLWVWLSLAKGLGQFVFQGYCTTTHVKNNFIEMVKAQLGDSQVVFETISFPWGIAAHSWANSCGCLRSFFHGENHVLKLNWAMSFLIRVLTWIVHVRSAAEER